MRSQLLRDFESKSLSNKLKAKRWGVVDAYVGRGDNNKCLSASTPTFNKWIEREPVQRLKHDVIGRIQAHINTNGGTVQ